jgi:hypothetical protein
MVDKNLETLEKIEHLVQNHQEFTDEDILVLKRVIHMVRGLDALGSFAGFVKATVLWIGIIVGAFFAIKNGAIEFILNVVSGR